MNQIMLRQTRPRPHHPSKFWPEPQHTACRTQHVQAAPALGFLPVFIGTSDGFSRAMSAAAAAAAPASGAGAAPPAMSSNRSSSSPQPSSNASDSSGVGCADAVATGALGAAAAVDCPPLPAVALELLPLGRAEAVAGFLAAAAVAAEDEETADTDVMAQPRNDWTLVAALEASAAALSDGGFEGSTPFAMSFDALCRSLTKKSNA